MNNKQKLLLLLLLQNALPELTTLVGQPALRLPPLAVPKLSCLWC